MALEFYWAGNKNIPLGTSMGHYERPNHSYDFGTASNWFIKNTEAVGTTFGYIYENAARTPENGDMVVFRLLANNPELGLSGDFPTNACLFGGITAAVTGTGSATGEWDRSANGGTGNLFSLNVYASYGLSPYYFPLGNTFGTTFGSYTPGPSAGITFQGLAGLCGNSLGTLQLVNSNQSYVLFGVSSGMCGASSNATTIGTKGPMGASAATTSLYNAFNAAITAGTLLMHVTNYTGSADTEFTVTQNVGGGGGNTVVTGSLIDGITIGVTGSTFNAGVTSGGSNTANFSGGVGITKENALRVFADFLTTFNDTPTNLVDSVAQRARVEGAGQFNWNRGSMEQYIQRRASFDLSSPVETSTYLLDTEISNYVGIAGGTFGKFINGVEQSANRPVTYIRASGGIPSATVRAFRKGLVQIFGDIDNFESHPEWPHQLGEEYQGRVELTRRTTDTTLSGITATLTSFNDENMIAGSKTNNTVVLDCGMTITDLGINSGLVKVGPRVGDRKITIVDGNISGIGKLMARSESNPSYTGIKIGGSHFPTNGATGGVTLPEGLLISDPDAEIEFSTGHYVMAAFHGTTSSDDAWQKPLPPAFPGT